METGVNLANLSEHLSDLFGIPSVDRIDPLPGGYKCQNFRLQCGSDLFFLKQYRHRISHWIAEIKFAEQFFASHGLPVILPLPDRFGRPMFLGAHFWKSLFPYVEALQPPRGTIADTTAVSLGSWLGRFHLAGKKMDRAPFQELHGWDREAFHMEVIELERRIEKQRADYPFLEQVQETLRRKAMMVERTHLTPRNIPLPYDTLLHGDFIYQNVFIGTGGEVSHVFDLEKTCRGPRAYELARSLLINCFDTNWNAHSVRQARLFLSAYRDVFPITFQEFYDGMRMYMIGVAHSTWIESRIVLGTHEPQHEALFASHALRIQNITDDPKEFCEALYH